MRTDIDVGNKNSIQFNLVTLLQSVQQQGACNRQWLWGWHTL